MQRYVAYKKKGVFNCNLGRTRKKSEDASLTTTSLATQIKMTTPIDNAPREAHRKLFNKAYELAQTPTIPLQQFEELVKCQCKHGVHLIKRNRESHACKE